MEHHTITTGLSRFRAAAWATLVFNLAVMVWGAFVRATGSGAGCGEHWPTCRGEVIPRAAETATLIEFTHRATSGMAFLAVLALLIWGWRRLPARASARTALVASMVFMVLEAGVGAYIVLRGLTADNPSPERAVVMAIHLVNTFLLVAGLVLSARWADGRRVGSLRSGGWSTALVLLAMGAVLVLGSSGAVTALGDTLFPVDSLGQGLAQDLSPTAHFLIKLRVFHPLLGLGTGVLVSGAAIAAAIHTRTKPMTRLATALFIAFWAQVGLGVVNLLLLAPVGLQLAHLALAELVWIALVLVLAEGLSSDGTDI